MEKLRHRSERWQQGTFHASSAWSTVFANAITLARVEDGALLTPRQFDMGNSELNECGMPSSSVTLVSGYEAR